jgi:BMFP domain-containing protein YqiC
VDGLHRTTRSTKHGQAGTIVVPGCARLGPETVDCCAVLDFLRHCNVFKTMLNPKLLDEMSARVSSLLAATPAGEVEKNLRAALSGLFAKLDLVTREEFDVQREVLSRTREKLVALEARVSELEARSRASQPSSSAT